MSLIRLKLTRMPARMVLNEKSVADEIWTFFGSGTNLQELYINPELLSETMWDELADAARWSRENSNVLVDTHWIGGDPAKEDVYGWASWQPGKGIVVLRNPSDSPGEFTSTLKDALELPDGAMYSMSPKIVYPRSSRPADWPSDVGESFSMTLQPFETIVIEL